MIDYEKLDKLMELPVSEEMLGAYIEGNLSPEDAQDIRSLIDIDNNLELLLKEVSVDSVDSCAEFVLDGSSDIEYISGNGTRKRPRKEIDGEYDDVV